MIIYYDPLQPHNKELIEQRSVLLVSARPAAFLRDHRHPIQWAFQFEQGHGVRQDFRRDRPSRQSIIPDTRLRRPYLGPRPSFPALLIEGRVSYRPHSRS